MRSNQCRAASTAKPLQASASPASSALHLTPARATNSFILNSPDLIWPVSNLLICSNFLTPILDQFSRIVTSWHFSRIPIFAAEIVIMVTCGPEARDPRGCSTRPSRARAVPIFYWHPPWIDQYPKFKFQEMEAVIIIHSHLFLSPCLMAPLAASLRSTGMRRLASGSGAHRSGSPPWPCRSRAGRGTFTRQKARCHGCREVAHVDLDRPTTLQSFPRLAPFGLRRRPCHPETAGSRPASLSAQ